MATMLFGESFKVTNANGGEWTSDVSYDVEGTSLTPETIALFLEHGTYIDKTFKVEKQIEEPAVIIQVTAKNVGEVVNFQEPNRALNFWLYDKSTMRDLLNSAESVYGQNEYQEYSSIFNTSFGSLRAPRKSLLELINMDEKPNHSKVWVLFTEMLVRRTTETELFTDYSRTFTTTFPMRAWRGLLQKWMLGLTPEDQSRWLFLLDHCDTEPDKASAIFNNDNHDQQQLTRTYKELLAATLPTRPSALDVARHVARKGVEVARAGVEAAPSKWDVAKDYAWRGARLAGEGVVNTTRVLAWTTKMIKKGVSKANEYSDQALEGIETQESEQEEEEEIVDEEEEPVPDELAELVQEQLHLDGDQAAGDWNQDELHRAIQNSLAETPAPVPERDADRDLQMALELSRQEYKDMSEDEQIQFAIEQSMREQSQRPEGINEMRRNRQERLASGKSPMQQVQQVQQVQPVRRNETARWYYDPSEAGESSSGAHRPVTPPPPQPEASESTNSTPPESIESIESMKSTESSGSYNAVTFGNKYRKYTDCMCGDHIVVLHNAQKCAALAWTQEQSKPVLVYKPQENVLDTPILSATAHDSLCLCVVLTFKKFKSGYGYIVLTYFDGQTVQREEQLSQKLTEPMDNARIFLCTINSTTFAFVYTSVTLHLFRYNPDSPKRFEKIIQNAHSVWYSKIATQQIIGLNYYIVEDHPLLVAITRTGRVLTKQLFNPTDESQFDQLESRTSKYIIESGAHLEFERANKSQRQTHIVSLQISRGVERYGLEFNIKNPTAAIALFPNTLFRQSQGAGMFVSNEAVGLKHGKENIEVSLGVTFSELKDVWLWTKDRDKVFMILFCTEDKCGIVSNVTNPDIIGAFQTLGDLKNYVK